MLGLLHAALPNARIIHMQAQSDRYLPLDLLPALSKHSIHTRPILPDLAHYYGEYRRLMRHWRSVLPADALLEVPLRGAGRRACKA
jgi:hypothetical protein